jgi:hypothetical protein
MNHLLIINIQFNSHSGKFYYKTTVRAVNLGQISGQISTLTLGCGYMGFMNVLLIRMGLVNLDLNFILFLDC